MPQSYTDTEISQDMHPPPQRHGSMGPDSFHHHVAASGAALIFVEELSHRVINEYTEVLSLLRLAAAETADANARQSIRATASRLRGFAEGHRALQAPLTEGDWDLAEHLEQICSAITLGRLFERDIRLDLIRSNAPLSSQRCWRIGLIVAELITNSSRHAFKRHGRRGGRIVVEVYTSASDTCCRISDDGGIDVSTPRAGRGTAIIQALAQDLKGCVQWQFGAAGTIVELVVPTYG